MKYVFQSGLLLAVMILLPISPAAAQEQPISTRLTLLEAVETALANHPSIQAANAHRTISGAAKGQAMLSYLPKFDILWQTNKASRNNVFGMLLPQSVIPSISGPVLGTNTSESVWGSAVGGLLYFEIYDFGRRGADLKAARALETSSDAEIGLASLKAGTAAADAFLLAVSADRVVRASEASVRRMELFTNAVKAMVNNELRPGVDASRAEAELAAARIQLINARKNSNILHNALAERLGRAGRKFSLDAENLTDHLPANINMPNAAPANPEAVFRESIVESAIARKKALGRTYFPRVQFQTAYYSRGSGAMVNGLINSDKGLRPDIKNWAAGVTLSMPLFDFAVTRARRMAAEGSIEEARAQYDETIQRLTTGIGDAESELEAAIQIAEETGTLLRAATDNRTQVNARYSAGLATIIEVADAEQLLVRAEIGHTIAYLDSWRALFSLAEVSGGLEPAIGQLRDIPHNGRE